MFRFVGVLFAVCASLAAQSNFATLSGRIQDPSQAPISGARVTVKAKATQAVRLSITNDQGLFETPNLLPGEYSVEVSKAGFAVQTRGIVLEVGQRVALDFSLTLGEQRQTVLIVEAADVLKTQDVSLGEVVEPKSIDNLPLNGRQLIDLALTVPEAHVSHGAQTGDMSPLYWRPGQASSISIGGNRPNANYFLLDGVTNTDPTFNTINLSPSPDAVQEFQVQTGSYLAELGGSGGGQINIITRQGTSQFHGTAYEFLRNNALDARTWNEMPGASHLVRNNFGGAVGGPLVGKKTFFFANYEGLRQTQAQTTLDTVPTAAEAGGDFSNSGVTIYDPSSSHANPNYNPALPVSTSNPQVLRNPFPNNVIPAGVLYGPAALMLKSYVPRPNTMGGMGLGMTMNGTPTIFGSGLDSNNLEDVRDAQGRNSQGTIRVDRVLGQNDTLNGRYSSSHEAGFSPQNLPGYGLTYDNASQNGSIIWTKVISPTVVNTSSVGVSRLALSHWSQNSGVNDIVDALGITGTNFGGKKGWGAPYFNVQGYSPLGDFWQATPMEQWNTTFEGRETLSWQKGQHSLKFGVSFRRVIWPMWALVQSRGYYQFTPGFTTQTATNDGTGSALASFLLGDPASRQLQAGVPSMNLRNWAADAFAQDTWRLTPSTTLDFGLRYEFETPLADASQPWSNLLQENGKLVAFIGGQNGMPRGLMYPNLLRFAPRVGLAQNFKDSGIVFRAAYGIFYTPVDMNTWCNQLHNVPVLFPITQQSDNFTPQIAGFNFPQPVLGKTVVSFASFDPHAPSQYVQQWSGSLQKSLGRDTTLEIGYHGERGEHLQQSVLINNALPGPGAIQPRRPYATATFAPGTVLPAGMTVQSTTFPISTVNLLRDTARSWYDAGYINLRRRYAHGLSLLANYTWAKNLSNAPDFRSAMFEAAIPQNDNNLDAEKGPACDIRHRFSFTAVYEVPAFTAAQWTRTLTRNWRLSTSLQVQSGFPFTVSVFGDTANAGTAVGENPIRANYNGQSVFGTGTGTTAAWFNPAAFSTPAAYTFGNVGRNTVYGPGMQTVDLALVRAFVMTERLHMELRAEGFNALNHSNWGTPNRFVNTPQFGTITEASTPGRELQLGARLSF
ncbi:MAG TPA: carboxypeptidase regulatory-like domain-containing protein [Bryobacteraceae bacterium]|nr:carboxypeptidase regulatory-like domain-containing protein [Bryobacteraceae bacterium]